MPRIEFKLGIVATSPISLRSAIPCEGAISTRWMSSIQAQFYRNIAVDDYSNRYLAILIPDSGCLWQGKAIIGGRNSRNGVLVLQNTSSPFVLTHELGHTLGLGHSNLMFCKSGSLDGKWGEDCRSIDYGGSIDVMGSIATTSPLSTYHQWRLGWISDLQVHESWISEEVALSATTSAGKTKAVFIRDGLATYWIEFRQATEGYGDGLVIYRTDPPNATALEDSLSFYEDYSSGIAADVWMLNLDNFVYAGNRYEGSMTLPVSQSATFFSRNVSVSATKTDNPNIVSIKINRRMDNSPPPTPILIKPTDWLSPDTEILKSGFADLDSTIDYFEIKRDGKVARLEIDTPSDWNRSYLNPLRPLQVPLVRDLPRGRYKMSIRSVDVWSNKSEWSAPVDVYKEQNRPNISNEFQVLQVNGATLLAKWIGLTDKDSGICETTLANEDGWVLERAQKGDFPTLELADRFPVNVRATTFDCLGNGVRSELSITPTIQNFASAKAIKGKWAYAGTDRNSMQCTGKCSISFSVSGSTTAKLSRGKATVFLDGKNVGDIGPRRRKTISVKSSSTSLRFEGNDFSILWVAETLVKLNSTKSINRAKSPADPSSLDKNQIAIAQYGFQPSDFEAGWKVLPIARGTTLEDPTFDYCEFSFLSENDRKIRRQVAAESASSPYTFLSTEVVRYRSETTATNAFTELSAKVQKCERDGGGIDPFGAFIPYELKPLPDSINQSLPGAKSLSVSATYGDGTTRRHLLAFFIFNDDLYTGLYLSKEYSQAFTESEIKRWRTVAATLANRMVRN